MRHFIVLGFDSNSQNVEGEQVHLGTDRGKALDIVNKPEPKYARKELFELAVPQVKRHNADKKKPAKKK